MPPPDASVRFHRQDPEVVLGLMDELSRAEQGWINLSPEVAEETISGPGVFPFLSARGPQVPLCTWMPAAPRRRRRIPPSVGIQHATGPRVVARLAQLGHPAPDGWWVAQDHPRRGLVLEVRVEETNYRLLQWLMTAGEVLCPLDLTGSWSAAVYRRRA
ncbi:MAG TPA: hypothetical protein VE990_03715 [Acidimicrobiales bacterium]|nr:hypothetical protein [Acidimicrobiales bacterium]